MKGTTLFYIVLIFSIIMGIKWKKLDKEIRDYGEIKYEDN